MKHDEFAFLNQQLAGMLRAGLPLEGALKKLSKSLGRGELRTELGRMQSALEAGEPLDSVLDSGALPVLYRKMVRAAVKGNDLPGMLTLLADYYQRLNGLRTRLKGLLVYPCIVLAGCIALSVFLTLLSKALNQSLADVQSELQTGTEMGPPFQLLIWLPLALLGTVGAVTATVLMVPPWRRRLRWRTPGFREGALAQLAASIGMMLRGGTPLPEALDFAASLEPSSEVRKELARWSGALSQGARKFGDLAEKRGVFPPLFFWLVEDSGEDLAEGFRRAAGIYETRARQTIELALYAALPVAVLFLGVIIIGQVVPVVGLALGQGSVRDAIAILR